MGHCAFGWVNRVVSGAVMASAEVTGLTASQVQNDHGATSTAWQTPVGTTTAYLQVDAGSSVAWDALSLHNCNLTEDATVRWRLSDAADFASSIYDSTALADQVVAGYRQAVHVLASTVTARYLRVDLDDPTNPENVLRVAQMFAGPISRSSRNFGFSSTFGRSATTPAPVTRGGQEFPELHFTRRAWQIAMPVLAPEDVWTFADTLQRAAEPGGNILFVPFPEGADVAREAVFGRLVGPSAIGWAGNSVRARTWSVTITERL